MLNFAAEMDYTLNIRGRLMDLSEPCVMGILNATPDSFYDGSRKQTERDIAERANEIVAQGGRIIDVGGYSTRPGAAEVSEQEEMERLRRALTIVRREQPDAVVSVDTFRPDVARMCVEELGADIVNDVSEGVIPNQLHLPTSNQTPLPTSPEGEEFVAPMFRMVSRLRVPYILMSVQPDLQSTLMAFARKVEQLRRLGQKDIILDPGFGFGKTLEQNYKLMGELDKLLVMELPVLVGISRKSMIYRLLDTTPAEALPGTIALNTIALAKGASILRVHDVSEAVACCAIQRCLGDG